MTRILVVEDDTTINQIVTEFLKENGYKVTSHFDGQQALDCFHQKKFDLIILDIMIPSVNGLEILKAIRKTSDVPVMMLTAMDDEYTQLLSFNQLISDYVVKPFSPLILMKRVENILRSSQKNTDIRINNIRLDTENTTTYIDEQELHLTKTEYDILEVLLKRRGKLVTRDNLMCTIWGYSELDSRILDNHIKNLRKKIPTLPLITVIGRGYKIEVDG